MENPNDFPPFLPLVLTDDQRRSQEFNPVTRFQYINVLTSISVPVGNVGGGTDDLMSYTIPAGTLDKDGKVIGIKANGTTANNANGKTLSFFFGSQLQSFALTISQAGYWDIDGLIIRTSSGQQSVIFTLMETTQSHVLQTPKAALFFNASSQDDVAPIVLKMQALAVDTSDILQREFLITTF